MRPTLRLGRVTGIPVGVQWGALATVLVIGVGLAVATLPTAFPGPPAGAYAIVVDDAGRVVGIVSPREVSNAMAFADLRHRDLDIEPRPRAGVASQAGITE